MQKKVGWAGAIGSVPQGCRIVFVNIALFKKARAYARSLGLKSRAEWRSYNQSDKRPADIPAKTDNTYLDKGWAGYPDWLGHTSRPTERKYYIR